MDGIAPPDAALATAVLDIADLSVTYGSGARALHAVRSVSMRIMPGEAYGLIGESGSGKSTIAYAVMRYLAGATVTAGRLALRGRDLLAMGRGELRATRGSVVSIVYQDPMSALNPVLRVGEQVAEVLRRHRGASRPAAAAQAVALLDQVHLPDPAGMAQRFPHQLSGGQQQRVVIAMAIACRPALLVMDEPTTGLDVTTEAVILELVRELRAATGAAVLFISHNLAVVAQICDRIGVLYAGALMEEGPAQEVLHRPRNPYTLGLLNALPLAGGRQRLTAIPGRLPDLRDVPPGCIFGARCDMAADPCRVPPDLVAVGARHASRCHFAERLGRRGARVVELLPDDRPAAGTVPRLRVTGLDKTFRRSAALPFLRRAPGLRAVAGVSLDILPGRTLAVVGESGSGKSTLARCIAGLLRPDGGSVELNGRVLKPMVRDRSERDHKAIQFIFQNPEASLNPRQTIGAILARPLVLYTELGAAARARRVIELLDDVKLGERYAERYPRELSGGEKHSPS